MAVDMEGIRVKDVERQAAGEYYNWNDQGWDAKGAPQVVSGHHVYIAFSVKNRTNATVSISLKIRDVGWTPGADLAVKPAEFVAPYGIMGIEFTGNMPYSDLPLSLIIMTGNVVIDAFPLTITPFGVIPPVTPPPTEPPVTPPFVPTCVMTAIGAPLLLLGFLRTHIRPNCPRWFVKAYYKVNYHILSIFY